MIFRRSNGQAHDAPEGRALLESWEAGRERAASGDDRACDETRGLVQTLGMTPVVPPKANRKAERDCDRELYKLRNEVERLFRRFKSCRHICARFHKLDAMFLNFAVVVEMICDLA